MTSKIADLSSKEKEAFDKFISLKKRTKEEIERFLYMIISQREQPNKNPQLKASIRGDK